MTKAMDLLRTILNCGELELALLENVRYNWGNVLNQIGWPQPNLSFNDVMGGVISLGIIDMRAAIEGRRNDLQFSFDDTGAETRESREFDDLGKLDPDNDIQCSCNGVCVDVWFNSNESVYRQWLQDEIEKFEANTGFNIRENA